MGSEETVAGGTFNAVSGQYGFVGGGNANSDVGLSGTIAGGNTNAVKGDYGFIGGGAGNRATAQFGSIGGGESNQASGQFSTVPGGQLNTAHGRGSFAAGMGSNANDNGDFVWSDDPSGGGVTPITVTGDNEFLARARGGVKFFTSANLASGVSLAPGSGTWSSLSDRNVKSGIVPVSDDDILARVASLPISEWSYTTERGVRHVGPMAQDFFAAFNVGEDDRHITSIDEDGVAIAAIKALDSLVKQRDLATKVEPRARKDAEIGALQRSDSQLRRQMAQLASEVAALRGARR